MWYYVRYVRWLCYALHWPAMLILASEPGCRLLFWPVSRLLGARHYLVCCNYLGAIIILIIIIHHTPAS